MSEFRKGNEEVKWNCEVVMGLENELGEIIVSVFLSACDQGASILIYIMVLTFRK